MCAWDEARDGAPQVNGKPQQLMKYQKTSFIAAATATATAIAAAVARHSKRHHSVMLYFFHSSPLISFLI